MNSLHASTAELLPKSVKDNRTDTRYQAVPNFIKTILLAILTESVPNLWPSFLVKSEKAATLLYIASSSADGKKVLSRDQYLQHLAYQSSFPSPLQPQSHNFCCYSPRQVLLMQILRKWEGPKCGLMLRKHQFSFVLQISDYLFHLPL